MQHVDGAQRHEEPAGALRLLADHAVLERDPLVLDAGREAAGPEAREHRVAVLEARAAVGRRGDRDVEPACLRHLLGEAAHELEPFGIEVDEHDLGAVEVGSLMDERGHRPGAAGRASTDVRHFDAGHLTP